jgi:methylthioxylose transferase
MEATTGELRAAGAARGPALWVPAAAAAVAAVTIGYGLVATARGTELGTDLAPFLASWEPRAGPLAPAAAAALAGGVALAPRLAALSGARFAAAALTLGLGLRLALAAARHGVDGWYAVYQVPNHESASEYLPSLVAFEFGTRFFLDTFAEVGTSLPVHSVGHPPALLVTLHELGIGGARGMAALTIGVGALSIPLAYLLARRLLDERRARHATLLYVFAPSAVLFGATSADALYATVALAAAVPLVAASRATRALGPPALAVASFFSYANLAIGAWATLVVARRDGPVRAAALALSCGAALAAFYGVLHLATGYDPVGAFEAAGTVYREGIATTRPYAFWVLGSPVAFLVALGLPTAWFALRAAGAGYTPAAALLAVVVVAAVLGFTKAETERIYLFLVPLACVAAAAALPERRLPGTLAALAVQALACELLLETVW